MNDEAESHLILQGNKLAWARITWIVYDAQQVLAHFAQTARDEVEMEALQAKLLQVIQETMQPNQISVWLKEVE